MAFHEVRFPEDISRGARGGPSRRTQIVELASGAEERNASWSSSRRRFDVAYGIRRADDLAAVVAFFEARNGRLYGFRFKDWGDYKSCLPSQSPAATDQVIGIGDGSQSTLQLVKHYTSGSQTWSRVIEKPVAGSVTVALDSTEQPSGWSLDETTGLITFDVAPGTGVVITAGFQFDVPVRFDTDELDVTLSLERHGSITSIPLIEIRRKTSPAVAPLLPQDPENPEDPGDPPSPPLTVYRWGDVLADHSAAGGEDWSSWGTSAAQPLDPPLDWFLRNVVATDAPENAVVEIISPTGEVWINGRFQPPPRSLVRDLTLDFSGNVIKRGYDGTTGRYGQFFLWGEKVNDPAMDSVAVVDVDAAAGDLSLILRDDADTDALMSAAVPGSIVEIRTNTTAFQYHPDESRATMFVASTNPANRSITFSDPLPLAVPRDNPIGDWETSDPSTVTLLQGSLLSTDAPAGSQTISMSSALGLETGDWILVQTEETSELGKNQWADGIEPNFDLDLPDHDRSIDAGTHVPINQEIHEIAGVTGNTVTLVAPLGKNKQVRWQASAVKLDPIEGLTLKGGSMFGGVTGGPSAWDHQYVWTRYMIHSTIEGMTFDGQDRTRTDLGTSYRRVGQAIRFDTGHGNLALDNWVGAPQRVGGGEGYGMSCRLGERHSVIRGNFMEGCRHSIEFWATSGGCIAEANHTTQTTSSCIDTHGNWNTGVIIRDNLIERDAADAVISGDTDGEPDAIRIGNNKFIFDENIQVLNNRVINFDGNALSVVPGVHNVTVDGLEVSNVYRVLNLQPNARNGNLHTQNLVIRNVTADGWRDKCIFVWRQNGSAIFHNLTLENWTLGARLGADIGNAYQGDIDGIFLSGVDTLTLRNVDVTGPVIDAGGSGWGDIIVQNIAGLSLENVTLREGYRGLGLIGDVTEVSGDISIRDITGGRAYWKQSSGTKTGALTLYHNQPTGPNEPTEVEFIDEDPADPLMITTIQI